MDNNEITAQEMEEALWREWEERIAMEEEYTLEWWDIVANDKTVMKHGTMGM